MKTAKQSKASHPPLITPLAEKPMKKPKSQPSPITISKPDVKLEIKQEMLEPKVENLESKKSKNDSIEAKKRQRKDSVEVNCPSKKARLDEIVPISCIVCSKQFQSQVLYE